MKRDLFLLFIAILLILFRFLSTCPDFTNGQKIRVREKVTSEPIDYQYSQRIIIAGLKTYLPPYPKIDYGDTVIVEGMVDSSDQALKNPVLIELKETKGFLYKTRKKLVDFYQKNLPEPHSSLVAGVTLGSKANIPENFWNSLKLTGTAHVVVASGMNVTLVAGFLMGILVLFVKRRKAIPLALTGIWIYTAMSGFDAPLIRSAIMGSIAFTAVGLGKLSTAFRALIISALVMLIIKPAWLTDLGFILSFVATSSLMLFEKRVWSIIDRINFKKNFLLYSVIDSFKRDLSTTIAAQIGVTPILYFTFGYISIWSPLINASILWTIPPITIIGMISGILSLIYEPLGRGILYLSYPLTSWFIGIIENFS